MNRIEQKDQVKHLAGHSRRSILSRSPQREHIHVLRKLSTSSHLPPCWLHLPLLFEPACLLSPGQKNAKYQGENGTRAVRHQRVAMNQSSARGGALISIFEDFTTWRYLLPEKIHAKKTPITSGAKAFHKQNSVMLVYRFEAAYCVSAYYLRISHRILSDFAAACRVISLISVWFIAHPVSEHSSHPRTKLVFFQRQYLQSADISGGPVLKLLELVLRSGNI